MRFSILGPLRVDDDGKELAITAGRDRTVLAMLLLHPDRIVSVDRLIDAVWGEDPPATARGQLITVLAQAGRRVAVAASERFGYRSTVIEGRSALGAFYRGHGRSAEALEQHRMALDVADELDEGRLRSSARTEFGLTLLAAGDRAMAIEMLRQAVDLAGATEVRYEEARSRPAWPGRWPRRTRTLPGRHGRHALAMFREMGVPEQFEVEKWLAEL